MESTSCGVMSVSRAMVPVQGEEHAFRVGHADTPQHGADRGRSEATIRSDFAPQSLETRSLSGLTHLPRSRRSAALESVAR